MRPEGRSPPRIQPRWKRVHIAGPLVQVVTYPPSGPEPDESPGLPQRCGIPHTPATEPCPTVLFHATFPRRAGPRGRGPSCATRSEATHRGQVDRQRPCSITGRGAGQSCTPFWCPPRPEPTQRPNLLSIALRPQRSGQPAHTPPTPSGKPPIPGGDTLQTVTVGGRSRDRGMRRASGSEFGRQPGDHTVCRSPRPCGAPDEGKETGSVRAVRSAPGSPAWRQGRSVSSSILLLGPSFRRG